MLRIKAIWCFFSYIHDVGEKQQYTNKSIILVIFYIVVLVILLLGERSKQFFHHWVSACAHVQCCRSTIKIVKLFLSVMIIQVLESRSVLETDFLSVSNTKIAVFYCPLPFNYSFGDYFWIKLII